MAAIDPIFKPITMWRIRETCMKGSNLPSKVKNFNAWLLANDLNKMSGANIRIKDARGNPRSQEEICRDISEFKPDIDKVCMITGQSRGEAGEKAIRELAKYMNRTFGANILLDFGNGRKPSTESLCRQLYQVTDQINRSLTDDAPYISEKLKEQIEVLELQKKVLEQQFREYINNLSDGRELDEIRKRVTVFTGMRDSVMGYIDSDIDFAKKQYGVVKDEVDKVVLPRLRSTADYIKKIRETKYGDTDLAQLSKYADIIKASQLLGLGTNDCIKCYKKFDLNVQNYKGAGHMTKFLDDVLARYKEFSAAHDRKEISEQDFLNYRHCLQTLIHDYAECRTTTGAFDLINEFAGCEKLDGSCKSPNDVCSTDTTDGKCKPDFGKLKKAIDKRMGEFEGVPSSSSVEEPPPKTPKAVVEATPEATPANPAPGIPVGSVVPNVPKGLSGGGDDYSSDEDY